MEEASDLSEDRLQNALSTLMYTYIHTYVRSVVTSEFIFKVFPQNYLHLPLSELNTAHCGNCALLGHPKVSNKDRLPFNPGFV